MPTNIVWNQSAVNNLIKEIGDKLELVGEVVRSNIVDEIDKQNLVDTGRYRNSISAVVDKENLNVRIGTNLFYSVFLEFGTVKFPPHPAMRYGFYASENKIKEIFSK